MLKRLISACPKTILLVILALSLASLQACSKAKDDLPAPGASLATIGAKAPHFELMSYDGRHFSLDKSVGSPVVVNFWASWCGPCAYEAPAIEQAYRKYSSQGVAFAGIAVQDSAEGAKGFIKDYSLSFPTGPDENSRISALYAITGIPKTYVIRKDGTISYMHTGIITLEKLSAEIERVLQ